MNSISTISVDKRGPAQSPDDASHSSVSKSTTAANRDRFLRACRSLPTDHAPIWLMRQAGRVLPEYRALKEKYTFTQMVQNPELAAEVTLQPIRRFDFDAAILFSDILVIPEAMGQGYQFREQGGVQMSFDVSTIEDIDRLETERVCERLHYAAEAIRLIKRELSGRTALIGFSGSPWTLANFMMEGGSSKDFARAKNLFYTRRDVFDRLCEKLTRAVIDYLRLQIEAGVDAIQIFDSLGGVIAGNAFEAASGRWMREIIRELNHAVPVILFAKGAHGELGTLSTSGADVLGVDWSISLTSARQHVAAGVGLQGNLDPHVLELTPEAVERETRRIVQEMEGRPGHIFNLGHGVPPSAKLECIERLVTTVRNFHEHA